jgi:capsule polysaccharide modification protein KpsS
MIDESPSVWEGLHLSRKEKSALAKYLHSRKFGSQDWIRFSDTRIESTTVINDRDYYLALTSVSWDAELHYDSRAFPNMKLWLKETIEFFKMHSHLKLIVRVHPAEITSPNKSRESMADYLSSLDIKHHPNIVVIQPSDQTSTYDLIERARVVIIYNTKTGIEASCMGKPVITAGEAWIKGKGISYDAFSPREYVNYLNWFTNPRKLSRLQKNNAKKYAYYFFFKRMIRINLFSDSVATDLLPNKIITWQELVGEEDSNFQEIISAIIENRTPIAKRR